jgi:hypothetical protein
MSWQKYRKTILFKTFVSFLTISLIASPSLSYASSLFDVTKLPVPGATVFTSQAFVPVLLKGMTLHPEDPLKFDFIIDSGNTQFNVDQLKEESQKLVKYFLASMTIPKDDLWVNLSPEEKDRIIPDELAKTELGRDMLAQDYLLKQLSASLLYPEKELGEKFWKKIYAQAKERFGTTEIPVNTFNKVWIIPEKAAVYEHEHTVYIVDSKLKVMLDADYTIWQKNKDNPEFNLDQTSETTEADQAKVSSQIIREIIIPAIEEEVNTGENFAPLRQIYHSLILAKWYKETVKETLLSKVYVDQKKVGGIEVDDATFKEQIYDRYMEAYKQGVFNYIKEDYDQLSQEIIPRKYFSGGLVLGGNAELTRASSAVGVQKSVVGETLQVNLRLEPQGQGSSPIKSLIFGSNGGSQGPSNRFKELEELLKNNGTRITERVMPFLSDPDPSVRARAVRAIVEVGGTKEKIEEILIRQLQLGEYSDFVVRLMMDYFVKHKSVAGMRVLISTLYGNLRLNPAIRLEIVTAIEKIGSPEAIPFLERMVRGPFESSMRIRALEVLFKIDPALAEEIAKEIKFQERNGDNEVREAAKNVLSAIAQPASSPVNEGVGVEPLTTGNSLEDQLSFMKGASYIDSRLAGFTIYQASMIEKLQEKGLDHLDNLEALWLGDEQPSARKREDVRRLREALEHNELLFSDPPQMKRAFDLFKHHLTLANARDYSAEKKILEWFSNANPSASKSFRYSGGLPLETMKQKLSKGQLKSFRDIDDAASITAKKNTLRFIRYLYENVDELSEDQVVRESLLASSPVKPKTEIALAEGSLRNLVGKSQQNVTYRLAQRSPQEIVDAIPETPEHRPFPEDYPEDDEIQLDYVQFVRGKRLDIQFVVRYTAIGIEDLFFRGDAGVHFFTPGALRGRARAIKDFAISEDFSRLIIVIDNEVYQFVSENYPGVVWSETIPDIGMQWTIVPESEVISRRQELMGMFRFEVSPPSQDVVVRKMGVDPVVKNRITNILSKVPPTSQDWLAALGWILRFPKSEADEKAWINLLSTVAEPIDHTSIVMPGDVLLEYSPAQKPMLTLGWAGRNIPSAQMTSIFNSPTDKSIHIGNVHYGAEGAHAFRLFKVEEADAIFKAAKRNLRNKTLSKESEVSLKLARKLPNTSNIRIQVGNAVLNNSQLIELIKRDLIVNKEGKWQWNDSIASSPVAVIEALTQKTAQAINEIKKTPLEFVKEAEFIDIFLSGLSFHQAQSISSTPKSNWQDLDAFWKSFKDSHTHNEQQIEALFTELHKRELVIFDKQQLNKAFDFFKEILRRASLGDQKADIWLKDVLAISTSLKTSNLSARVRRGMLSKLAEGNFNSFKNLVGTQGVSEDNARSLIRYLYEEIGQLETEWNQSLQAVSASSPVDIKQYPYLNNREDAILGAHENYEGVVRNKYIPSEMREALRRHLQEHQWNWEIVRLKALRENVLVDWKNNNKSSEAVMRRQNLVVSEETLKAKMAIITAEFQKILLGHLATINDGFNDKLFIVDDSPDHHSRIEVNGDGKVVKVYFPQRYKINVGDTASPYALGGLIKAIRPLPSYSFEEVSSSPISSENESSKTDNPGGIDLNTISIERQGEGIKVSFDKMPYEELLNAPITGFRPIIINIQPIPNLLPLLGLEDSIPAQELLALKEE